LSYILECYISNGNGQLNFDVDKSDLSAFHHNKPAKSSYSKNTIASEKEKEKGRISTGSSFTKFGYERQSEKGVKRKRMIPSSEKLG